MISLTVAVVLRMLPMGTNEAKLFPNQTFFQKLVEHPSPIIILLFCSISFFNLKPTSSGKSLHRFEIDITYMIVSNILSPEELRPQGIGVQNMPQHFNPQCEFHMS